MEVERLTVEAILPRDASAPVYLGDNPDENRALENDCRAALRAARISTQPVDGYVELAASPGRVGWKPQEVIFNTPANDYEPFTEMAELIRAHPAGGKINRRYGLLQFQHREPFTDSHPTLIVDTVGGDWTHVVALNRGAKPLTTSDFRQKHQMDWKALADVNRGGPSPLYHNVNTEVIVLTSDNRVVFGLRGQIGEFARNQWSVTLEEQMLRLDPDNGHRDTNLFECAERGVMEELAVPLIQDESRLLSFGLEWGNFTAAFLVLVRTPLSWRQTVDAWLNKAQNSYELQALDSIPATEDAVMGTYASPYWRAKNPVFRGLAPGEIPVLKWHMTSRARLKALAGWLSVTRSAVSALA